MIIIDYIVEAVDGGLLQARSRMAIGIKGNLYPGMDIENIMRLGGWSSLDMVLTYTRSVKFEYGLKIYRNLNTWGANVPESIMLL